MAKPKTTDKETAGSDKGIEALELVTSQLEALRKELYFGARHQGRAGVVVFFAVPVPMAAWLQDTFIDLSIESGDSKKGSLCSDFSYSDKNGIGICEAGLSRMESLQKTLSGSGAPLEAALEEWNRYLDELIKTTPTALVAQHQVVSNEIEAATGLIAGRLLGELGKARGL